MEEVKKEIDRAVTLQERHIDGYKFKIQQKENEMQSATGTAVSSINKQIELFNEKIKFCETAIEALERIKPQNVLFNDGEYSCYFCGRALNKIYNICAAENAPTAFCPYCGQAQGFEVEE